MRERLNKFAVPALLIVALGIGVWVNGGDLNPPPGPVRPTMKTLAEIEPRIVVNAANTPGDEDSVFKISQPGSYYLTGSVAGQTGKSGIEIAADHVSLDLQGFSLAGVPGSLSGILVSKDNAVGIRVANGVLRAWAQFGLDGDRCGGGGQLRDLRAIGNGAGGIIAGGGFIIVGCSATDNTGNGIRTEPDGAAASVISQCAASSNSANGIQAGVGTVVQDCTANDNAGVGIVALEGTTVQACTVTSNGAGINTLGTVKDCSISFNTGYGILLIHAANVSGCTVSFNETDGIVVEEWCIARNNQCTGNLEAGIRVAGRNSRICQNNVGGNGVGIAATGEDNVIIQNTASDNTTNYDMGNANHYGQIITDPGQGFSNSNPWANLSWSEG